MTQPHLHDNEGVLLKQDAIRDAVRRVYGGVRPTDCRRARSAS
jgi:hypothetical protein